MEPERLTIKLDETKAGSVEWLWSGRIPYGYMTLIDGDGGLGKSSLTLELASALSVGRKIVGNDKAHKASTIILTSEDDPIRNTTVIERVKSMGGNPRLIRFFKEAEDIDIIAHTQAIEREIVQIQHEDNLRVGCIIIDPITDYLLGGTGREQSVRKSLKPILLVAAKLNIAVIAIRHLTKQRMNAATAGLGSVKLRNMARSQLLLAQHPNNKNTRVVASAKNNLGVIPESLTFIIDNGFIKWTGSCTDTADQLLRPDGFDKGKRRLYAREFLEDALSMGALPVKALKELSVDAQVSWSTLLRAADDLGVEHKRVGFSPCVFWWYLPGKKQENSAFDQDARSNAEPPGVEPGPAAQPEPERPVPPPIDPRVVAAAALLGIGVNATEDEIATAFRAKVRVAHPDLGGSDEATREIIEARDVMLAWVGR